jgi:tRNA1(Val) A37 N6-methylase TrmN6
MSELRRGVYFCGGLPKSTMYRPQMAKMVTHGSKVVLDPCAGWGGRMLGSVSNGNHYIAFEPNTKTYDNLKRMAHFLGIENNVTLICDDALNMDNHDFQNAQTVLTSPPYFDLEIYTNEETQSISGCTSYSHWESKFLDPLIKKCISRLDSNGKSCWNVSKVRNNDMWNSVNKIHSSIDFQICCEYNVISSARQVNTGSKKSMDKTICYQKVQ